MIATPVKEFQDTLWKAADKLRGSMDASQYKDIVLGLVFLKYVTDAFDARRLELEAELQAEGASAEEIAEELEDRDAYLEKTFSGWPKRLGGITSRATPRERRKKPVASSKLLVHPHSLIDLREWRPTDD